MKRVRGAQLGEGDGAAPAPGRVGRWWNGVRVWSGRALVAVPLLILLRLLIRDRVFPLNYIFYVPPPAWLLAALVLLPFARQSWRVRGGLVALTLAMAAVALHLDQPRLVLGPVSPVGESHLRVMSFNVKSYSWGVDGIAESVVAADPDVLCLVEGTFGGRRPEKLAKAMGAEYTWIVGHRLSIASRFPIKEGRQLVSREDGKVFRGVVSAPGGEVAVYVVDISPPTRRLTAGAFRALGDALAAEQGPAVMCGDFNSPRGSALIAGALGDGWRDCFREAPQDRVLATWPTIPMPLWQIDHAFVMGDVATVSADILPDRSSDHSPLLMEFRIEHKEGNQ